MGVRCDACFWRIVGLHVGLEVLLVDGSMEQSTKEGGKKGSEAA
jgi:hypothetical protein